MFPVSAPTVLLDALALVADQQTFQPLVSGIRRVLESVGVQPDRIQLPMTRQGGFRHPTLALVVMTWCHDRDYEESFSISHDGFQGTDAPVQTPYRYLFENQLAQMRVDLEKVPPEMEMPIFAELRGRGYRDYAAVQLPMPGDTAQVLSLASLSSLPDDLSTRMASVLPLIGLSVYAAYRTSQAQRLASTYIGPRSGPQVLAGDIRRGSTGRMLAGIMFCDIQGFTSLSEREAPETVVQMINEVFEQVEAQATQHNGEILKFIGDAMLLVFHADQRTPADVAHDIIETTTKSLEAIAHSALPIGIRIGATIGEVVQGNIGTSQRLDFTVMGTAVNLASRLEGLCRPLASSALFCSTIAAHIPTLRHAGDHAIKGLRDPVPVYRLPDASGAHGAVGP